jgi:hypothetical protein
MSVKKIIMLTVVVVQCFGISLVFAGADGKDLGISFDATWVSKYIWKGQDIYDDHAAFQPSISFDLYGTGFSANVWTSFAGGGGFRNLEEYDYSLAYSSTAFDGEITQTDYALTWVYYDVYDGSSRDNDSQDIFLDLAWPNLLGGKIVPVYQVSYYYAAKSGGAIAAAEIEGFLHLFGFDYDLPFLEINDNPLIFSWDIAYNDGQGSSSYDHDWAYITWGLSTSLDAGGGTLTPALYYQTSMDKSVNPEDEFWVGMSYGFNF